MLLKQIRFSRNVRLNANYFFVVLLSLLQIPLGSPFSIKIFEQSEGNAGKRFGSGHSSEEKDYVPATSSPKPILRPFFSSKTTLVSHEADVSLSLSLSCSLSYFLDDIKD